MDSATSDPMSSKLLWVRLSQNTPQTPSRSVTHPPHLQHQKLQTWPASPQYTVSIPPGAGQTGLPDEVLWLQGMMKEALEQLLMTRAIFNSHQRELAWNTNIARCQIGNQATEAIKEEEVQCVATIREVEAAIKEAETHCATQAYDLEQLHAESVLKLEHEVLAEEGHHCQAFVEACSASLWACPLKAHGVLMYPLLLLTGNVPLAATTGHSGQRIATNSLPTHSDKDAGTPNWNQTVTPIVWPGSNSFKSRRRGSGQSRHLSRRASPPKVERERAPCKTPQWEPEGSLQKGLWPHPKYEVGIFPDAPCWLWPQGSKDPSHTFQEMATSAGLMDSEVHEVKEVWTGQKDLWITHHVVKGSPKGIQFFQVVPPTESSKIMGLKGTHFPKALCWQVGLSFCLWCGKEGQNEGMIVNHLQMSHYCLGIICSWCLKHFTTSTKTMCHHLQLCKWTSAGIDDDDDQEEESNSINNSEDDFAFS